MLDNSFPHYGHGAFPSECGPAVAADHLDFAFVRVQSGALLVWPRPAGIAVLVVQHHKFSGRRCRVSAVHQHRTLINVRMAREHKVHAAPFENGHDVCAHFDQLLLAITIMRAFRVRRVMKECDQPIGFRSLEVQLEPARHHSARPAVHIMRIEANKMRAPIIK